MVNKKKAEQINGKIGSVIGSDVVLEGNLKATEAVRIEGTITGDVSTGGVLVVSSTGKVIGNVKGRDIMVSGTIEGDLDAEDRTEIASSGRVIGNVRTKSLIVDADAVFEGFCTMNSDGKNKTVKSDEVVPKKQD